MSGRCEVCRIYWTRTPVEGCEECQRHAAWGILVLIVTAQWAMARNLAVPHADEPFLGGLDAIAYLMTERKRQEDRARRAALDELRDMNRGVADAYSQGQADARAQAGDW